MKKKWRAVNLRKNDFGKVLPNLPHMVPTCKAIYFRGGNNVVGGRKRNITTDHFTTPAPQTPSICKCLETWIGWFWGSEIGKCSIGISIWRPIQSESKRLRWTDYLLLSHKLSPKSGGKHKEEEGEGGRNFLKRNPSTFSPSIFIPWPNINERISTFYIVQKLHSTDFEALK